MENNEFSIEIDANLYNHDYDDIETGIDNAETTETNIEFE